MRTPAKGVYRLRYRGFESLSFRHIKTIEEIEKLISYNKEAFNFTIIVIYRYMKIKSLH